MGAANMPKGTKPTGPHPHNRLGGTSANTNKPGKHADGGGLYLVVTKEGAKKWIWRAVVQGKRREIGLGSARTISLAHARKDARTLNEWNQDGKDVLAEWRRAKNRDRVPTFKEAALAVHAEHQAAWKNANHIAQWLGTLERFAFPVIESRRVDQIGPSDVLSVLSPIWLEKPETARRVRQRMRTVLDWAKVKGYRAGDNPVEGVSKALPKQRDQENPDHLAALHYSRVPEFLAALAGRDMMDSTRLALEFTVLTAARTGEVLYARKSEFDLPGKVWTVPAERMKAGREHRVPLTDRAVAIITAALALTDGSEYVFPGSIQDKPLSNVTMLKAVKDMGYAVTVHGFRSSFRDWAAERTNHARDVVEMALAHTLKDKTEAAYKRTDLFEKRRELMDAWEQFALTKPGKIARIGKRSA